MCVIVKLNHSVCYINKKRLPKIISIILLLSIIIPKKIKFFSKFQISCCFVNEFFFENKIYIKK